MSAHLECNIAICVIVQGSVPCSEGVDTNNSQAEKAPGKTEIYPKIDSVGLSRISARPHGQVSVFILVDEIVRKGGLTRDLVFEILSRDERVQET